MSIDNLVRIARAAEASGQIGKAAQLCQEVLLRQPACIDALLILGSIAAQQGRLAEAEAILRKAASIDPDSYDAVRWLTTLLIGRDGGQEAVDFGITAVRLRPNEAQAHVILGLASMGAGNYSHAIECFQQAIELNPQMSGAYHNLGVANQRDDNYDDAIESYRRALELSPNVAETHLHLGRAYLAKKSGDEAIKCAQRALALNPSLASARRLRANASFAAVIGDNGQEHLQNAIESNPESGFPYALMGSRLQEQGSFAEAEQSLLRSIELEPNQGLAYYLLAHNRKVREQDRAFYEKIEPMSDKDVLDRVNRQYLNFALGKAFDDLREYEKAIRYLDQANDDSDSPEAKDLTLDSQRHVWRTRRYIELFTPEFMEQFKDAGVPSEEPIFIFGMPRSGTTLLEQIISRHSKVGAAGEQSFWRDGGRRILKLEKGLLYPEELKRAGNRYLALIRSIAPGMAHVTDKFPSNYVYLGLLHLAYPNAKFIHARRHPLDTSLSIYMRPFFDIQEAGRTRRRIVEMVRLYRESMDHWRKALPPGRFLDVDYEDMVQNPEAMTRKVIAYCGLEWEDACLRPEEGDRRVITFSKWQVRQPVYTTSVERWRNYEPWLGVFRELLDPEFG